MQGLKREVDFAYSKEEAMVNDALVSALAMPAELLRARGMAGPAPRFGFVRQEPRLEDVLASNRYPGPDRRMDYSGAHGSYTGTARPGLSGI